MGWHYPSLASKKTPYKRAMPQGYSMVQPGSIRFLAQVGVMMGTSGAETRKRERTQQIHTPRPSPTMEQRLQVPNLLGPVPGNTHGPEESHEAHPVTCNHPQTRSITHCHSAAHRFTHHCRQACTSRPGHSHTQSHTCTQ